MLTVWFSLVRLEFKLGKWIHPLIANWIHFIWETMMPKELEQFIHQYDVYKKLEVKIKENTAINLVNKFLKDDHLDNET